MGERGQRTRRKQEPAPLSTVIPGSAPEASALGGSTQVTQARRAAPLYRPQICVITCPWLPRVRASGGRPKCQVLHARKCPWSRITSRVPLSAAGLCTRTPPARTLAAAVLSQGMAARPQIYAVRHAPRRPSFSGPAVSGPPQRSLRLASDSAPVQWCLPEDPCIQPCAAGYLYMVCCAQPGSLSRYPLSARTSSPCSRGRAKGRAK